MTTCDWRKHELRKVRVFPSCLLIFSQIVTKLWQVKRKANRPSWLLLTSYQYRGPSGATTHNILELFHIAMILSVSYLSSSLRKYPSAIIKYHASQKSCFGNVRLSERFHHARLPFLRFSSHADKSITPVRVARAELFTEVYFITTKYALSKIRNQGGESECYD